VHGDEILPRLAAGRFTDAWILMLTAAGSLTDAGGRLAWGRTTPRQALDFQN